MHSPTDQTQHRPTARDGCILVLGILFFHIAHYAWRVQRDELIMAAGLGLLFVMLPLLLFVLPILTTLFIGTIWYMVHTRGNLVPILFLFVGYGVVQQLPLPPSPAETAFYRHKADYEAVVQMARREGLTQDEECKGYGYSVPGQYRHLSADCIFLLDKPALAIVFRPATSHRVIVYAERPEALKELMSWYIEGSVFKRLEASWYICTPAQD